MASASAHGAISLALHLGFLLSKFRNIMGLEILKFFAPWHQDVSASNFRWNLYSFVIGILWACGFTSRDVPCNKKNSNLRKTLIP